MTTDKDSLDGLLTAPLIVLQEKSRENAIIALCTNWLMGCRFSADNTMPTAYTDGVKVAGNYDFFESLGHEMMAIVLAHESLHALLGHIFAMKEFGPKFDDPRKQMSYQREANIAMDILINTLLESIFNKRIEWKMPNGELGKGMYIDTCTPDGKYIVTDVGRRDFNVDTCDFYWVLRHLDRDALQGSGKGDGEGGLGDGCDIAAPADAETEAKAQEGVQRAVAQTQATSKYNQWGSVPGWLQRFFDKLSEPKQDWRRELSEVHHSLRPVDYSFRRLKSPYIFMGAGAPTMSIPGLGTIVFGNDTSGSMTDEIMGIGISELRAIWQSNKPEKIHVLHIDAEIGHVDILDPEDHFEVHPKGGGGTDFRPLFEYVKNMDEAPAAVIFFTDGYGSHAKEAPDCPVIWLLPPGSADDSSFPFGRIIRMESV